LLGPAEGGTSAGADILRILGRKNRAVLSGQERTPEGGSACHDYRSFWNGSIQLRPLLPGDYRGQKQLFPLFDLFLHLPKRGLKYGRLAYYIPTNQTHNGLVTQATKGVANSVLFRKVLIQIARKIKRMRLRIVIVSAYYRSLWNAIPEIFVTNSVFPLGLTTSTKGVQVYSGLLKIEGLLKNLSIQYLFKQEGRSNKFSS
jgi:hypothetical protein